jgi:hypothetical protein
MIIMMHQCRGFKLAAAAVLSTSVAVTPCAAKTVTKTVTAAHAPTDDNASQIMQNQPAEVGATGTNSGTISGGSSDLRANDEPGISVVAEVDADGVVLTSTHNLNSGNTHNLNSNAGGIVLTSTHDLNTHNLNSNAEGIVLTSTHNLNTHNVNSTRDNLAGTVGATIPASSALQRPTCTADDTEDCDPSQQYFKPSAGNENFHYYRFLDRLRKLNGYLNVYAWDEMVHLAPEWALRNFRGIVQEIHVEFRENCMHF